MPVSSPPKKMYEVPLAVFTWKLDGDKKITLSKTPGFVLTQMKFSGTIFVAYFNNGLYEMLKTSSRQNI